MRVHNAAGLIAAIAIAAIAIGIVTTVPASAQTEPEVYTATVIASEGVAGSSGRIRIRIDARTTEEETTKLRSAFKTDSEGGVALLSKMTKGVVTVESEQGRPIYAVFDRKRQDGTETIIVAEHIASKLQVWKKIEPTGANVAVIHLRFGRDGAPLSGEIFPAVKLSLGPDGLIDAQTNDANKVIMTGINRR